MDQAVLEVRALRHKPKLEDISFTLRRGEVLGIAGLLGQGAGIAEGDCWAGDV